MCCSLFLHLLPLTTAIWEVFVATASCCLLPWPARKVWGHRCCHLVLPSLLFLLLCLLTCCSSPSLLPPWGSLAPCNRVTRSVWRRYASWPDLQWAPPNPINLPPSIVRPGYLTPQERTGHPITGFFNMQHIQHNLYDLMWLPAFYMGSTIRLIKTHILEHCSQIRHTVVEDS